MATLRIDLNGFTSRQWHNELGGKKFRSQVRRRAERLGGERNDVDIYDSNGFKVDVYTCPATMAEYHRIGRAAGG